MKRFRTLNPDEIECRIAQAQEKGVQLLLYKTARTDYDLLDETYGPEKWQNDYREIKGNMYCGIGVYNETLSEWVWKWNCGTESNTEAEKGEASDAMKRAGTCIGIGRELYSSPFIWIKAEKCKKLKESNFRKDKYGNPVWECKDKFNVAAISYDDNEKINYLAIRNQSGEVVFESGEAPNSVTPALTCEECFRPIVGVKYGGKMYSANDIAQRTMKAYNRFLCHECAMKMAKAEKDAKAYAEREDGVE